MPTSDGITDKDWQRVIECTHGIVTASSQDDGVIVNVGENELMCLLDELESKYGPLPSILAVRGDFSENIDEKKKYLELAFEKALTLKDDKNLLLVSTSLCELMIEDLEDENEGQKWLSIMFKYLKNGSDYDKQRYKELSEYICDLT